MKKRILVSVCALMQLILFSLSAYELEVYGFVKLDVLAEDRITGPLPEITPIQVPLSDDQSDHHSQIVLDARQSRIGVRVKEKLCEFDMLGGIEGDFYTIEGDAVSYNSRRFRLRLAYAKADWKDKFYLLFGQYYTLTMNYPNIPRPDTVDSNTSPVGCPISRVPQFRFGYRNKVDGEILIEGSIEKHGFDGVGIVTHNIGFVTPNGGDPLQGLEQRWPLFATRVSWFGENLKLSVALAYTKNDQILGVFDSSSHSGYNSSSSMTKSSLKSVSGSIHVRDEVGTDAWVALATVSYTWNEFEFWMTAHHNVGLSSVFPNSFPQVYLDKFNHLKPIITNGGTAMLQWNYIPDVLWFVAAYGYERAEKTKGLKGFFIDSRERYKEVLFNVFYQYCNKWQFAVGLQREYAKAFNGKKGHVDAIHLGIWYFFYYRH